MKPDTYLTKWIYTGAIAIIVAGSLLHFVFEWSGESTIVALIAPVNESVWEHLKMGYWSLFIFSLFEWRKLKIQFNNYFLAKFLGILALEFTIIFIHYSYIFLAKHSNLWVDISSYVLGAIICQVILFKVIQLKPIHALINKASLAGIISLGILLGITTFYPPHHKIFKDSRNDTYGIRKDM